MWIALSQFENRLVALPRIALVISVHVFILKAHVYLVFLICCNIRCFEISGLRRLILECHKGRWYFRV